MKLLQVTLLFTFVMLLAHVSAANLRGKRGIWTGGTLCKVDSDCPSGAPFCVLVHEDPPSNNHYCLNEEWKKKQEALNHS